MPYFIWIILVSPFRAIIAKSLLELWNPISLQLINEGFVGLLFFIIFFKSIKYAPKKSLPLLFLTNLLTTTAWILYFFSFQKIGIVYTVLIFSLEPILVYISSLVFLKEKFHWKKATAFFIIIIVIILSRILG